MTHEDIKKFIYIVIDMEKNLFIQERTWNQLNRMSQQLGRRYDIPKPVKPVKPVATADTTSDDVNERSVKISTVIAVAVILLTIFLSENIIKGIFWAVVLGIAVAIIGIVTIKPIVAEAEREKRQKRYDDEYVVSLKAYENKMAAYKREVAADEQRVKNELCRRKFVCNEIQALEKQYHQTKNNLNKLYSSNIIADEYRHDMVAICSFYQYLIKGMTYSLTFDRATGDKGAYNIYEEEKRLGLIVSKLDDILNSLDKIINNQQVIVNEIRDANDKILSLCNGVDRISIQISAVNSSIKEQTAVQQYNEQRKYNEMRYMNMMNSIHIWHY